MDNDIYVVLIVLICNVIGFFLKRAKSIDNKLIPSFMGLIGAILGVIFYKLVPSFGIGNAGTALGLGLSAGLASTGAHQLIKQTMSKLEDENDVEK